MKEEMQLANEIHPREQIWASLTSTMLHWTDITMEQSVPAWVP